MDNAIANFLQFGTLILACAVFIVTFFVRKIVETAVPSVKKQADENSPNKTYTTGFSVWWNQVILYAIPVVIGCLFGLFNAPFMFAGDIKTMSGRIIFGGVIGWFSSFLYKVVRKMIIKKTGIDGSDLPTID